MSTSIDSIGPIDSPASAPVSGSSCMDYAFLRAEGIRHLERLAGENWTDFNPHDPGITILEQLCYAITDLGYRIAHPLPDLLTGSAENASIPDDDPYAALYSPATILSTEPVTRLDLRKLVLDVPGVRNAWIEPIDRPGPDIYHHEGTRELHLQTQTATAVAERDKTPVAVRGLHRVLIDTSDVLDMDGAAVQRAVLRRLHAHRPLCEDFAEVRVLEPQAIRVKARVEIAAGQDGEAVLLAIYQAVSEYMAPAVRFSTLDEMIAAGKAIDEIFDGPRLERGFIDDDALRAMGRRDAMHTSDLIRAIMDIAGVRAVRDITISTGAKDEPWSLELDPTRVPRLDLTGSAITLMREGLAASVDPGRVARAYIDQARAAAQTRSLPASERDLVPPQGRDRKVDEYTSIQHQFPACYGIGATGLPTSATPTRRAQARQLEAYLMFFDQLLANSFAQLGHTRTLLSFHGDSVPTYVAQVIDDDALAVDAIRQRDRPAHEAALDAMVQPATAASQARRAVPGSSPRADRENRFLDHLMARFGEQFTEYALVLAGALPPGESTTARKLARDKRAFLRNYPRISRARNRGFDTTRPWSPANVSGLEDRLRLALGLIERDDETLFLIEHVLLRPIPEDRHQIGEGEARTVPLLAASPHADPYSLQLSVLLPSWPRRFTNSDFRHFVEHTIRSETPAHITPYIHWLGKDDYGLLRATYREWLDENRGYRVEALGL